MADKNPQFKMSKLKANQQVQIILTQLTPTAEGSGQYGNWELYPLMVNECPVVKEGGEIDDAYTGEAVFFLNRTNESGKVPPTSKKIIALIEKGIDTFVMKKVPKENPKTGNFYTSFEVMDLEGNEY